MKGTAMDTERTAAAKICLKAAHDGSLGFPEIVGKLRISPKMAVRLEKAFGTPAREWLMRQLDYELAEVMRRAKKIKVEPFRASATESGGTHERRRD
ncbi:hypothetical protein [Rhodobacter sp. SGA-6-6]|uniref:helix-turn-helix transcriptional regulator n=1 Tax=Rhodobacter sp. SGA-6-6 TaxID=2710882 RepID=UPI00197CEB27|nr:hypothetical protein [Rhodobacter sp. SGA-6-6]